MPSSFSKLDLLIPGLLGPMSALAGWGPLPRFPLLQTILSRAGVSKVTGRDLNSTLFGLFGIVQSPHSDLPVAAFSRLADGGEADGAFWMAASPVYLRADLDQLLLFDSERAGLVLEEAEVLAAEFNRHFEEQRWHLEVRTPGRWYLRLPLAPDLVTHPLSDVIGRSIDPFLPKGGEASHWHGLLNEIQMLFHHSPVNSEREAQGVAPINGLWFHGGGRLPILDSSPFASVRADDPLARGLAIASSVEPVAFTPDVDDYVAEEGRGLVLFDALQRSVLDADPEAWINALRRSEDWIAGVHGALRGGRVSAINLYPCNGEVYQIDATVLRRFWRRRQPLTAFLDG